MLLYVIVFYYYILMYYNVFVLFLGMGREIEAYWIVARRCLARCRPTISNEMLLNVEMGRNARQLNRRLLKSYYVSTACFKFKQV